MLTEKYQELAAAEESIKLAAHLFNERRLEEATQVYEDLLARHPKMPFNIHKNEHNLLLHKSLAIESLIQQALKQQRASSYTIDISAYVPGRARINITAPVAERLALFKETTVTKDGKATPMWTHRVGEVFKDYRSTLLRNYTAADEFDRSSIYLASWLNDFFAIAPYLPKTIARVADIGCGVGGLNVFIDQIDKTKKYYTLIEPSEVDLRAAQQLLSDNGMSIDVSDEPYDLVHSMRSCCFIYSVEEYEDLFRNRTQRGSCFVMDVGDHRLQETLKFFNSFCESTIVISTNPGHSRYVFIR
jgi:hypothetical protein